MPVVAGDGVQAACDRRNERLLVRDARRLIQGARRAVLRAGELAAITQPRRLMVTTSITVPSLRRRRARVYTHPPISGQRKERPLKALIVEQGGSRGAVAAVRALASAGWRVGVGAPRGDSLAAESRHCGARHEVPAAHVDADRFLAGVRAAVLAGGYEVVFGAGEAEVLALSARRDEVGAAVPYAADAVVRRALDKGALDASAAAAGFALPATLPRRVWERRHGPVVVKARRHAAPDRPGAPPRIDTNVVFSDDEARRRSAAIEADGGDVIVQEFLEGPLVAYAAVTDHDGEIVADSQQVAEQIWPPHAGASCRAITLAVDEDIAASAQRLFGMLGWFGLAELQFIVPADGIPRLIDLNGRFYGSMSLAVRAGANLPAAWGALATGRSVTRLRARPGVRYQWLEGDVRRVLALPGRRWPAEAVRTGAWALVSGHSLTDPRDPAPALVRLRQLATRGRPTAQRFAA